MKYFNLKFLVSVYVGEEYIDENWKHFPEYVKKHWFKKNEVIPEHWEYKDSIFPELYNMTEMEEEMKEYHYKMINNLIYKKACVILTLSNQDKIKKYFDTNEEAISYANKFIINPNFISVDV